MPNWDTFDAGRGRWVPRPNVAHFDVRAGFPGSVNLRISPTSILSPVFSPHQASEALRSSRPMPVRHLSKVLCSLYSDIFRHCPSTVPYGTFRYQEVL